MSEEWRADLVSKYGEAVVLDIEREVEASAQWPCRDSMDGRRWCRIHDAPWPSWQNPPRGCDAWVAVLDEAVKRG